MRLSKAASAILSVLLILGSALGKLEGRIYDVLPKDAIRAIRDPQFAFRDERQNYPPAEQVVGLEIHGDSRAYPTVILSRHEIVNDVVGDVPVAVTWCPLCNTAVVYRRAVRGKTLTFGVSGKLYFNGLVLYDQETETLWSHVAGEGLQGPLEGVELEMVPAMLTRWGEWLKLHPKSKILSKIRSPYARYDRDRYEEYYRDPEQWGVRPTRFESYPNIMPKDRVLGIRVGNTARAYPFSVLKKKKVVNDAVGKVPVLLVYRDASETALAFGRLLNGKPLTFHQVRESDSEVVLKDVETGTLWNGLIGEAVQGRLAGQRLSPMNAIPAYWFAWKDFFPDSSLYL